MNLIYLSWVSVGGMFFWGSTPLVRGADCPSYPLIHQVQAKKIYSDRQGAIIDPKSLQENAQLIAPLRKFVTDLSARVDGGDRAAKECAQRELLEWAKGRALLEKVGDFAAKRERQRFALAFNILVLKLRNSGIYTDSLLSWLGELNHSVLEDFGRRNRADNLHVWSGVVAASYFLLSGDPIAKQYSQRAWRDGVGAIRADGFVEAELGRGRRALLYHEYGLSALLTLHAFRGAAGETLHADDKAKLHRLAQQVKVSLCNPKAIAAASGAQEQERVRPIDFGPIVAFAGMFAPEGALLGKCLPEDIPDTDPVLGGNLKKTAEILARLQNKH